MWDLLNKEKLKEQSAQIKELQNELSETKKSLSFKKLEHWSEKQRAEQLQEKCVKQEKAIELLTKEVRAFIIQNKDKELIYDALEIMKEIPKELARVKKYSIEVYIASGDYEINGNTRLRFRLKPYLEDFIDNTPFISAIDRRTCYISQVSKFEYCLICEVEFYSAFSLHKIQYEMIGRERLSGVLYQEVNIEGSHLKVVGRR